MNNITIMYKNHRLARVGSSMQVYRKHGAVYYKVYEVKSLEEAVAWIDEVTK